MQEIHTNTTTKIDHYAAVGYLREKLQYLQANDSDDPDELENVLILAQALSILLHDNRPDGDRQREVPMPYPRPKPLPARCNQGSRDFLSGILVWTVGGFVVGFTIIGLLLAM